MFLRSFKSKWFWLVWLILSFTGGIIGYLLDKERVNNLSTAKNAICIEFRNIKHPSIWGISNLKYKEQYLEVMLDSNIKTHNIPIMNVVENNQSVKIIGYSKDSSLVKIAIVREVTTLTQPSYEVLWLYRKFIKM